MNQAPRFYSDFAIEVNKKVVGDLGGYRTFAVTAFNSDGVYIPFIHHSKVPYASELALKAFLSSLENANSNYLSALAVAKFWLAFILLIHPFPNGNGRTAKLIVRSLLAQKGLELTSFEPLEKFLYSASYERDGEVLAELIAPFLQSYNSTCIPTSIT